MRKILLLTCYSIALCLNTGHCQKISNTLLWRISGNGLQKPSYLYGTMHLTDERLFILGDSLYKAIENTEGFAIEVNPEEMTAYLIDEISQQIKNQVLIKSVLSKKEFNRYSSALSKKLKKPADEITTRDIFLEKNKWVQESLRDGKMSTFLDAYLFDIARRLGKWTGGVEDMDDQKGLVDELIDESDIRQIATEDKGNIKGEANNFINLYVNANLNAIDSISHTADSAYNDALLVKRNLKMSRRIDSLGKIRSMVFAVGAAHLPGKDGLINLLQKKGYAVQPVFYSKKIKPENYKVKEVATAWMTVNDIDSLYKVEMPGKPGDIEMYGLLKMKMYFDIFNSTGYMVTAIAVPYDKKRVDSIMNSYATDLFRQKKTEKIKAITINGISGREMEITDADGYKHGYILSKNNIIYVVLGLAVKKNPETENVVNKFLSSYQPFENRQPDNTFFYNYTDSAQLYSVDLPSKPQSANELVAGIKDKSFNTTLMVSLDNQTGAYFFFGATKTSAGYFIENDSTSLRIIEASNKIKFTWLRLDTIYIEGEKRVLNMEGGMANLFAKAHYELIGNQRFGLLAMYDTNKVNPGVQRFFQSFKILNPAPLNWKQRSSEDGLVSTWVPDVIKYHSNDTTNFSYFKKYESYDSLQGNTYDIMATGFGKYYWQNSDTALWNLIKNNHTNNKDSMLLQRPVTNGNAKGIELQIKEKGSFNIIRKRILLYGDTLYTLFSVQPQQYINDNNTNKFFDDFKFNKPSTPSTIFTSKARQILNDLSDKDSTVNATAQQSLSNIKFDTADIPLLYEALLKTYTTANGDYKNINEELAQAISNIKDSLSLRIAKQKYALAANKQIKNLLLDIISGYKTKENYNDLKKILTASHPDTALSYSFISNVKDSLLLAADLINGILPLIKDTVIAPAIINISTTLIDSTIIPVSLLHPYIQNILDFAAYEYKKQKSTNEDYNYQDRFIIRLLGKLNTAQSNAMLQKWLSTSDNYLKLKCIEELLQNAQPVTSSALLKLAAEKSNRIDLYTVLKEHKKQSLFPKLYLSQQYFAETNAYTAASDDAEPTAITFLLRKIFMHNGKPATFFFFRITYGEDDDKTLNLACAGPYDLNPSNLCIDKAYGSVYYDENFDKTNLQQQMKDLIKQIEAGN